MRLDRTLESPEASGEVRVWVDRAEPAYFPFQSQASSLRWLTSRSLGGRRAARLSLAVGDAWQSLLLRLPAILQAWLAWTSQLPTLRRWVRREQLLRLYGHCNPGRLLGGRLGLGARLGLKPGFDVVSRDARYAPPQLFDRHAQHLGNLGEPIDGGGKRPGTGVAPHHDAVHIGPAIV